MSKKVSIIGLGWLGLPLAKKCRQEGFEVSGSTTKTDKAKMLKNKGLGAVEWSMGEPLKKQLKRSDCYIINIPPSKVENFSEKLSMLLDEIPTRAYVIFCSSTSVYGLQKGVLSEDSGLCAERASSKELILAEEMILERFGKRNCILRCSGLIGPKRHPIFRLSGRETSFAGEETVNLVHQEDIISIILKILRSWDKLDLEDPVEGVYNLSSGEKYSKGKYYNIIASKFGIVPPIYLKSDSITSERFVSNERARRRFNHTFKSILEYRL
jgi:nucleoside-diphosphate-sugar epimerase